MDESRLAKVEAQLAIQQLAIRYAIAVDSRDLELMAEQWVPDAWMGKVAGAGRDGVRRYFEPLLQKFYRSMHQIVGHRIDLIDDNTATGLVYCRGEHESHPHWIVQAIVYEDDYRRVDGQWGFVRRRHHHWYSTPIEKAPSGPTFEDWPSLAGPLPDLPHLWPSWNRYWQGVGEVAVAQVTSHPGEPTSPKH